MIEKEGKEAEGRDDRGGWKVREGKVTQRGGKGTILNLSPGLWVDIHK